jgi:hypothetical protein
VSHRLLAIISSLLEFFYIGVLETGQGRHVPLYRGGNSVRESCHLPSVMESGSGEAGIQKMIQVRCGGACL